MRVLWISNAPASASAYSQQTALFLPLLRKTGHEIVIFAFTNFGGPTRTTDGFLQLPRLADPYGNDVMVAHFNGVKADVAISLYDPFVFDPSEYARVPWCAWTPVDSTPVTSANVNSLKAARWIWAMSRFGEQQLKEAGFGEKTTYVPHGIDVQTFTLGDRAKAREVVSKATNADLSGKFLVAMVGANKSSPSRKGFYEAFSAFKAFSDKHPDAVLYVHSEALPTFGGEDLLAILDLVRLSKEKVIFVPQYPYLTGAIQPGYLAAIYNAADVYLSASHAEGFGIPCFPPDARVCTTNGVRPISALCNGDSVITHTGSTRKILATGRKWLSAGSLVELHVTGNSTPIRATPEHPILVIRAKGRRFISIRRALKRGERPQWISASKLVAGDLVCVPARQNDIARRDHVDLGKYAGVSGSLLTSKFRNHGAVRPNARLVASKAGVSVFAAQAVLGNYPRELASYLPTTISAIRSAAVAVGYERTAPVPSALPLNDDSGFIFGQYIAEGSIGPNGQIEFASHKQETMIRHRLSVAAERLWGLRSWIEEDATGRGNGARLIFTCKPLAEAIGVLCGKNAHGKKLPDFTFSNRDFATALIVGAWLGDGHFHDQGAVYTTVSEQLAYGMRQLLSMIGFHATLIRNADDWALSVRGRQSADFLRLFDKKDRQRVLRLGVLEWDGKWWAPVRSIATSPYEGWVHNLEIEADNSYCVEGFAVHNCIEAQACGCPVIVPNNSAQTELCLTGETVECSDYMSMGHVRWGRPKWGHLKVALDREYERRDDMERRAEARRKALAFGINTVFERFMLPALKRIESDLR